MALQRTRRPSLRSGRSLRSLGSPLNARPLGRFSLVVMWVTFGSVTPLSAQTVDEFPTPSVNATPAGIVAGPDRNVWFADLLGFVGRVTQQGVVTEFFPPDPVGHSFGSIVAGPDGRLWFTDQGSNFIGRSTTSGSITLFETPTLNSQPQDITVGPDGNMWFTEYAASRIGRITIAGEITEFPLTFPQVQPGRITSGSDGNLWFTLPEVFSPASIGRISPLGVVANFPLPPGTGARDITSGPDGNVWFIESGQFARITPSGAIMDFPLPAAFGVPTVFTVGPDNNLWVAGPRSILVVSTAGQVLREVAIPSNINGVLGITAGPDGNVWFTLPFATQPTGGWRPELCRIRLAPAAEVGVPTLTPLALTGLAITLAAVGVLLLGRS
jgi:virginiamycin B lyase